MGRARARLMVHGSPPESFRERKVIAGSCSLVLTACSAGVITDKDEVSSRVDKDAIEEPLAGMCRELIAVPHDRGVADGDLVTLDHLKPETRRAYKEIAAAIVDGYR